MPCPPPGRSKRSTPSSFIARKVETDTLLARLAALSDDHFNVVPEAVNWGHGASRAKKGTVARSVAQATKIRAGTKQAVLIDMLRSQNGATIEEIMSATGWQSHTVWGAFAGALKKKLGLTIKSDKIEGRGRVYRITD